MHCVECAAVQIVIYLFVVQIKDGERFLVYLAFAKTTWSDSSLSFIHTFASIYLLSVL